MSSKHLLERGIGIEEGTSFAAMGRRVRLDELIFRWYNLPPTSEVTVYFSDIDTAEIQTFAALRRSPLACEIVDKHTLKFKVAGATSDPDTRWADSQYFCFAERKVSPTQ